MGQRRSTEGEAELNLLGPDPMVVSLVVCRAARVATAEASLHPAGLGRASVRRWLLHGRRRWLLQGGRGRGWEGRGMYGAEGACPGGGRAAQRVGTGGRATGPASHRGGGVECRSRDQPRQEMVCTGPLWDGPPDAGNSGGAYGGRAGPSDGGRARRRRRGARRSERVREGTGSSEGLSESGGLPTGLKVGNVGCQLE